MVLEPSCKKKKKKALKQTLTCFTKINSKWITYLNVRCKTIKLLEGDTGGNLTQNDLGFGDEFLETTPKAQSMKGGIDQLDYSKLNSVLQKTLSTGQKDNPQSRRKHLQKIHLIKDCSPKYANNY